MNISSETQEDIINPLDHVEDVLSGNNWVYDRTGDDRLVVMVSGRSCRYELVFIWQESMSALQFICRLDRPVHEANLAFALAALSEINSYLWMGHFEISRETFLPAFRQTCLLRGQGGYYDHIEDLVNISLAQCERFQAVFQVLSLPEADTQSLSLAMMETAGET